MTTTKMKYLAMLSMLIDHTAAFFFCIYTSSWDGKEDFAGADQIYTVMRSIGRMAFPIYCFLLVMGFLYTHDVRKYLFRMFLFALISEIPFDLARNGKIVDFSGQNVFWTLFLGLLALAAVKWIRERVSDKVRAQILSLLAMAVFMLAAYLLKTDYSASGVLLIIIFYEFREERITSCIVGYLSFIWEYWCFPAFILIPFYNGEKGKGNKYFFYIFYPSHILLLYIIRILLLK